MINLNNVKNNILLSLVAFSLSASAVYANTDTNSTDTNSTLNLGIIDVGASVEDLISTAPFQAPTKASLLAKEPTSIIDKQYISHNASPIANYTDVIAISPSVTDIAPNGSGAMESAGTSIRGFQDGQFNLTFDSLPISDSNDFTHHSPDYLMAQDLDKIVVDRGPGNASTIGVATFGGTVAITSKNPSSKSSFNPYFTFGSNNTRLYGLKYQTGKVKALGNTKAYISIKKSSTDGVLNLAKQERYNILAKSKTPLGNNTIMTLFAMYNDIHQNVPYAPTKAQIAKYGKKFGNINNNPASQRYYENNKDKIGTDVEYVDLRSYFGDMIVHNKLYTYAYRHQGFNANDPYANTAITHTDGTVNTNPGLKMYMYYRSIGDILRITNPLGSGKLRMGIWLDHQVNQRAEWNVNWDKGGAIDTKLDTGGYTRHMENTLDTIQPYVQYEWKPTDKLSIEPGVKVSNFGRSLTATVNQHTGQPLIYSKIWTKTLPSISVHYKILDNWTTYAQWAKGYLAPNLNTFYVKDPSKNTDHPEETTNYQIGSVYQNKSLTVSGDIYYIDFNNKVQSRTVNNQTEFYNAGGAIYKGAEAEATVKLIGGLSLYLNGSLNSAKTKDTKQWLANTAKHTYATGLIFNKYNAYASLIAKNVGTRYGDSGQTQELPSYTVANFSASYNLKNLANGRIKNSKVSLKVDDLFDNTSIMAFGGYTSNNVGTYWSLPGRTFNLSFSMKF